MVEQAVRPIVEAIVAQAPRGWTHAVLHSRAGRGGTSATGGYSARGDGWGTAVPNPFEDLMALAGTLCEDRGWEPVSLEIRCGTPVGRPAGRGQVTVRLAAARLAVMAATFDDALAWAARLGLDTDNALRATGTLRDGRG
ncbi:hypothetical protein ACFT7S_19805 [Streptomyces sp. NPDC057136]|uniref:hypothetical protein n=1 Tax=Streptomyces sp. NPDC057136 TaxID=3346029 RepID=UPI0036455E79